MMPVEPSSLQNTFKAALLEKRQQIGLWSCLASNIVSEAIAGSGFDWILLDCEHSPNEIAGLIPHLQAMMKGTAEPIVRVAWNDFVLIKRILDLGVRTLLVPYIQSAEEARRAVAATRYPPEGIRGVATGTRAARYGRDANYLRTSNSEMCVLLQIETRAALGQLEAIAAVEGVDGIFIGPSDLSTDMGYRGNARNPEVQAAIADACARIRGAGKAAGFLTSDPVDAAQKLEMGFTFVAVGTDLRVLVRGCDALAAQFKTKAAKA
jgi:4-hydroxy-2-oxoheptanedioate aldolase